MHGSPYPSRWCGKALIDKETVLKHHLPNGNTKNLKEKKKLMAYLLANSAILITLYFFLSETLQFLYIAPIYLAVGAGLGIYYVIYNRGFVAKNATPDMLPDTMTLAEKQAFLQDAKERLRRSRWVLTILIPIVLAFLADVVYLYLFPQIKEMLL